VVKHRLHHNDEIKLEIDALPHVSDYGLNDDVQIVGASTEANGTNHEFLATTGRFVSTGVPSSNVSVTSGVTLEVLSGGIATATNVANGGIQRADASGLANATIDSGGGKDDIFGSERGASIGGVAVVGSGGTATSVFVGKRPGNHEQAKQARRLMTRPSYWVARQTHVDGFGRAGGVAHTSEGRKHAKASGVRFGRPSNAFN
jgi:autotransporter passenger strand-loop-strand repeat protein